MKRPPSASSGANAIACRTPSTRPQRSRSSAASASSCSGSLTSSSSTSGGSGSRAAERSVMRLARPKPVSTISAPASWAWRATSNAIDSRLMTPVMRSFLPSSMRHHRGIGTKPLTAYASSCSAAAPSRRQRTSTRARATTRSSWLTTFQAKPTSPASSPTSAGLEHLAGHAQRVAELDGALEDDVADAPQRDHALRVERDEPARQREHEEPVGDALAERGLRRPDGVGVLRVPVAGERREADHVGLGDGAPAGGEGLSGLEFLEGAAPVHRGMFLTPCVGDAMASRVVRASPSRRRVSDGGMTSST